MLIPSDSSNQTENSNDIQSQTIPIRGPVSGLSSSRMMSGAVEIVRRRSSAATVHSSQGCSELGNSRNCRKGYIGSPRASALATVDRRYNCNALIVADLSNDATYAEVLFETFGPRVIGLQITRYGDGMSFERRPVKNSAMLVYTIGRTYLLELFHSELQSDLVRFVDGPMARRPMSNSWN